MNFIQAQGVAFPRGSQSHPRTENGVSKKTLVELREVKSLIVNSQSETFYGTRDDDFDEFKRNVERFGILQPIIVCRNEVQVGNRRLRAAIEAGLDFVPVVEVEDEFDLARIVASQASRIKTPSMMIKELHILDEAYGIRQGSRSDLRREVQEEVQKMRLKIAGSQGAISNLRKIKRLADHFFYNDPQGWDTFLNRMDRGELTIFKAVNFLKDKLAHESRERHPHLVPAYNSEYTLYNSDSFGFEGLEDASVQCIVTSPPYYKMRDYNLGSNELGKEDTPWKFAKRLADFMNQAKRVLKSDGSLFVNLGDKVEEGNYTLSPQMFAILMKQNGWILNDEIVWTKTHCRPSPDVRANRNHEYIYHFVLNREFKYFPNAMTGRHQFPGSMRNSTVVTSMAQNDVRSRICTELGVPFEHTATYPEFIPLMAIKLSTEPGDLVVDPFTGSGTTGIVSLELGRKFVGYELNPEYFNVASTLIQHHINVSTRPAVQTSNDPVEVVAEIEDADQVEFFFE